MVEEAKSKEVYCICPNCKTSRRKENKHWTIIKRGKERNGIARFLCRGCNTWFNEKSGHTMEWYDR